MHHERPNGSRDPSSFSFISRGEIIMRDGDFDEEEGRSAREGIWISGWKICGQIGGGGCGEEWSGGEKLRFD